MILIAIGANLLSPRFGPPRKSCPAALRRLEQRGVRVVRRSHWYESAPEPPGPADNPWPSFVNGVVAVQTDLGPGALLELLHDIEAEFGRAPRSEAQRNAPRVLDLDLIDYEGRMEDGSDGGPVLPHPRLAGRAFVLLPLADVAPDWRHPATGATIAEMIAALPSGQRIRALP